MLLILLPLAAFTKPTIILNTTTPNSGEPLQINCSSTKFDKTASFLYEIQVNSTTVASENSSFVHIIESVNSTESGNYTCKVSSTELFIYVKYGFFFSISYCQVST